jgi:hypothetical protein
MWTPGGPLDPFTKAPGQAKKSLQILGSRRPDSNRGPLHYEYGHLSSCVTWSHLRAARTLNLLD